MLFNMKLTFYQFFSFFLIFFHVFMQIFLMKLKTYLTIEKKQKHFVLSGNRKFNKNKKYTETHETLILLYNKSLLLYKNTHKK